MIDSKLRQRQVFETEEICYMAKTLLEAFREIHLDNKGYTGLFKAENIFLSPQGALKIYPATNIWH